jgi:hypothetical protein
MQSTALNQCKYQGLLAVAFIGIMAYHHPVKDTTVVASNPAKSSGITVLPKVAPPSVKPVPKSGKPVSSPQGYRQVKVSIFSKFLF